MRLRWTRVRAVAMREGTNLFRDIRTLVSLILLPVLILPLSFLFGLSQESKLEASRESEVYGVGVEEYFNYFELPSLFVDLPEQFEFVIVEREVSEAVLAGEVEVVLEFKEEEFRILYDASRSDGMSLRGAEALAGYLRGPWAEGAVLRQLEAAEIHPSLLETPSVKVEDLATPTEVVAYGLGRILPLIILLVVMQVISFPAIDSLSGERERGTAESLLSLPLSGWEIVAGKSIIVFLIGLMALALDLVLILGLAGELLPEALGSPWGHFIPAMAGGVALLVFYTGLFMMAASWARTTNEANGYLAPLYILSFGAGFTPLFQDQLASWTYFVPGMGGIAAIRGLLSSEATTLSWVGIGVSIGAGWLFLKMAGRRFASEETILGVGGIQWGKWWREERVGARGPTPSEGWALFGIAFLLFILGSVILDSRDVEVLVATPVIQLLFFLGVPLVAVWLLGLSPKKVGLGKPAYWSKGFLLGITAWIVSYPLGVMGERFFPSSPEVIEMMSGLVTEHSLWVTLFVLAVTPALAEEVLFRGFLLSAFQSLGKRKAAFLSALLFAFAHLHGARFLFTLALGILLAYLVYKTGSIWAGCVLHFTLNGLSVVLSRVPLVLETFDSLSTLESVGLGMLGLALTVLGLSGWGKDFKKKRKSAVES